MQVGDEAVKAIALSCPNLRTLGLKCCKNVTSVQSVLENCARLRKLNVAFTSQLIFDDLDVFPKHLELIVVDGGQLERGILKEIKESGRGVNVFVSLSEYNTKIKRII